ncbi:hypothetical protein PG993_011138, partial [Apiospora rasikravindrae]
IDTQANPLHTPGKGKTGVLSVNLYYAAGSGPRHRSGLRLPEHASVEPGSADLADPEVRRRWVPCAVLEYDNAQVTARAKCWVDRGHIMWKRGTTHHFDVTAVSKKLHVRLLLWLSDHASEDARQRGPVLLGSVSIDPFYGDGDKGNAWADLDDGTGWIHVETKFEEKEFGLPEKEDGNYQTPFGGLVRVSQYFAHLSGDYAMTTCTADHLSDAGAAPPLLDHPFIASLRSAFRSPDGVRLSCSMGDGGNLFGHPQRERRFSPEKAKFYAIVASLKPENVWLDPFGHISICSPGLFGLDRQPDGLRVVPYTPDCPAPELLGDGGAQSAMADWWTLGRLRIPKELPPDAKDLMSRLLTKDPRERLGSRGGASEIRTHAFFKHVKWQELPLKQVSPYRPSNTPHGFELEPREPELPRSRWPGAVRRLSRGILYDEIDFGFDPHNKPRIEVAQTRELAIEALAEATGPDVEDDDWDVAWQPASRTLCFKNRVTQEERLAGRWGSRPRFATLPGAASHHPTEDKAQASSDDGPSEAQSREALAAALALGYRSPRIVSQILALGNVNLNYATLDHSEIANTKFVPFPAPDIQITPLEWAVEHDRPDLARLFLDAGVDVNYTLWKVEGPALIKAVRKRNLELAEMLVPKSDRVTCTRALGLAATQSDVAIARALLEGGALCDFEEADRPLSDDDWDAECKLGYGHISELTAGDFVAPLALAVMVGDVALVRLLLEHGADSNQGYHGLYPAADQYKEGPDPAPYWIHFHSGRAVQLAMELGYAEMVHLLLDYGADIDLPQPSWEVPDGEDRLPMEYTCCLVPRSLYLRVMAGLEQAVEKRGRKEETGVTTTASLKV